MQDLHDDRPPYLTACLKTFYDVLRGDLEHVTGKTSSAEMSLPTIIISMWVLQKFYYVLSARAKTKKRSNTIIELVVV